MPKTYWIETLGCPKNQVDSDKLEGTLIAEGAASADSPQEADLVLVNTCAFISDSRKESLDTIQALGQTRKRGSKLVVTGCMAERYGPDIGKTTEAAELNIVDLKMDEVVGFGVPVTLRSKPPDSEPPDIDIDSDIESAPNLPALDLLNLPRPPAKAPWAYLKIAEGCDRKCGYCAIPSFRGPQRSRSAASILEELESLNVKEVVLIAQDLAAYGRDKSGPELAQSAGQKPIISLLKKVAERTEWMRLLYLYPSDLTDELVEAILATQVPYFDLSLQHVSKPLLRKMRRFGSGDIFLNRIKEIRRESPDAVFRSNFIVGYPGETESDHEELLDFLAEAQLDWSAFFLYSEEAGTYSQQLGDKVSSPLAQDRRAELQSLQLDITETKRLELVGETLTVLVDEPGEARSFREAPEIDGVIHVCKSLQVGDFHKVKITGASGCDLHTDEDT